MIRVTIATALGLLLASSICEGAVAPSDSVVHVRRVFECGQAGHTAGYCECIVRTSEQIVDNDPVLGLFLAGLAKKDKSNLKSMYVELLHSNTYNQHNFSSEREKGDYIEGRFMMLLNRMKKNCRP